MNIPYDMPKLMREAHARAKADLADDRADPRAMARHHPYSYYLGLQMRGGFREQREVITGVCYGFQIHEPARWGGFSRK